MKVPKQLEFALQFYSKLSAKERTIFYVAVFFLAVMLVDRVFIAPIFGKISALDEEIAQKRTDMRRDSKVVAQKERIAAEVARYSSYLGIAENEQESMTVLLKQLESFANKSKLYIVDMKPVGVKQEKDKTKRLQVNLSCEGLMEQVMEFMYTIENSPDLMVIEKYQISPKSRDTGIASCVMTVSRIAL